MRKIYQSIRNYINNLAIGPKINLILVIAVLAPLLLLSALLFPRFWNMVLHQTILDKQEEIAAATPLVENTIEQILSTNKKIRSEIYYRNLFSAFEKTTEIAMEDPEAANDFAGHLNNLVKTDNLKDVRIYIGLPESDRFFQSTDCDEIFKPTAQVQGSYWHGIFYGTDYTQLFCPSFYLSRNEIDNLGTLAYITRMYFFYHGKRIPCFLAQYYSSDIFTRILTDGFTRDGSVAYVITDRDAIVTSTDPYLSGIYHFDYSDIYNYLFTSKSYLEKEILGKKVYTSFSVIQKPNWFLVVSTPEYIITRKMEITIIEILLIVIVFHIISLFLAFKLSSSITGRISSVIQTMGRIREGSMVPMEEPEVHDEIGDLINTYNYMTNKQQELTETLQTTADELRIAEVNALQAQINPHFLYNTLDTIQWMATSGMADQVPETVQALSRFYKLTLGKDLTNTTIEKEIEHATLYIKLQNIRFNNAVEYIIDIPDEISQLPIPRLTLQPIVENAILHGIREKESREGCIVITGWQEDLDVYLLVSDDGIGISPDILPNVLSEEGSNPESRGANIAIYNVHHRLQLLYGGDYGLSYDSKEGEGTEVTIHIRADEA